MRKFILAQAFVVCLMYLIVHTSHLLPDLMTYSLYISARTAEGLGSGVIAFIINYLLSFKLIKNEFKGSIQGFMNSKLYAAKFLSPIAAGVAVSALDYNLVPYVASFVFYMLCYLIVRTKTKSWFRAYYRYISKRDKKGKLKFRYIKISRIFRFGYLKVIFRNDKTTKKRYAFSLLAQNSIRPVYDLYFVLFLTTVLGVSIVSASVIIGLMMMGLSFSFVTSFMFDLLMKKKKEFRENIVAIPNYISLILFGTLLYAISEKLIVFKEDEMIAYLSLITFIWGFTRSLFQDWSYRIVFDLASKEGGLENFKAAQLLISDLGHIGGYILLSGIYLLGGFDAVFIYMVVIGILLLAIKLNSTYNHQNILEEKKILEINEN